MEFVSRGERNPGFKGLFVRIGDYLSGCFFYPNCTLVLEGGLGF